MMDSKSFDIVDLADPNTTRSTFRSSPFEVTVEGVESKTVLSFSLLLKNHFINHSSKVKGPIDISSRIKRDFRLPINTCKSIDTIEYKKVRVHTKKLIISEFTYKSIDSCIRLILPAGVKVSAKEVNL